MKQPFEQVVAQHGATVLRVIRVLLGPHDAEDAWSETFLSALQAYPRLPETANVEAWLVAIAHRKAIDVWRSAKRSPLPAPATTLHMMAEAVRGANDEDAADADLASAVRQLPDKQRQAVTYHYVAALSYAEIAEMLGGSVEAARRAAADGIRNLRRNYPGVQPRGSTKGRPMQEGSGRTTVPTDEATREGRDDTHG